MPPKANSRHNQPLPPSLSSSSCTSAAVDVSHSREHFSLESFFDAASARRSGGGGGGYHVGSLPNARQMPHSSCLSVSTALPSGTHPSTECERPHHPQRNQQLQHWSSSALGHSGPCHRSSGVEQDKYQQQQSTTTREVSVTLQEVRRRILSELEVSQDGSRTSAAKLHAHRQRALRVAFGEDLATRRRASRSSAAAAGDGGAAPADARQLKSQHTPNGGVNEEEDELMVASVEFSLLCPYSRLPLCHPVRSKDCNHLQCCDLESWIVMLDKCRSMRDPVGPCPVCERRVSSSSLEVDLWVKNVIDMMPAGTHMVVLEPDGTFRNGDTARERRREQMMTEVVDATQADYENYFGDVVDSDDDVVVESCPATMSPASISAPAVASLVGPRRPHSISPAASETEAAVLNTEEFGRARSPPLTQVKTEKGAMRASEVDTAKGPSSSAPVSQDDGGVVVVHFAEGRHDGLPALPSQIRLWVPHCTKCKAPRIKAEDESVQGCQQCGHSAPLDWNLVRSFEGSSSVSMELVHDGTLVLRGVDLLASYLYRAGFYRSLFEVMEYASVAERTRQRYQPPADVWTSSFPLSRFEIDFLEACCARVAEGATLDAIEALMVPNLFRIPRRRRRGGGDQTYFTQLSHENSRYGGTGSPATSQANRSASLLRSESLRRVP